MKQIQVGPSRAIHNLDQLPHTLTGTQLLLDPGKHVVMIRDRSGWQDVIVQSADPHKRAVIHPDSDKPYGIFQTQANGSIFLQDLDFDMPGPDVQIGSTKVGGSMSFVRLHQNQGSLWKGSGGEKINVQACKSDGIPLRYYICNFDSMVKKLTVDQTGMPKMRQGHIEAVFRLNQVWEAVLRGLSFEPWINPKDGNPWKQEFQLRSGGSFDIIDSHIHSCAVGWMKDPNIPTPHNPIQRITFTGGSLGYIDWSDTQKPDILNLVKVAFGPKQVITTKTFKRGA